MWALCVVVVLAAEPSLTDLLLAIDDASRGEQSAAVISMHVKTARYERTMKMAAWSKGTEQTLVRLLEPEKDAGVTTLKVGENLWNYLPKVDRTMKVPAGMMSGSWMGSHFSNDDLVKDSRLSEDYACQLAPRLADTAANYVVQCTPKPNAPVVWGRVDATLTAERVPVSVEFRDESDVLVRTMGYSDVRLVDGRLRPMKMRLTPHETAGEFTELTFESLDFSVQLDDTLFSLQALTRATP